MRFESIRDSNRIDSNGESECSIADKTHKINDKDTDVPIERVDTIRDLGILIDEKLSFKEHIHDKIKA